MKKSRLLGAVCAVILLFSSNSTLAALIDFGPSVGAPATSEVLTNQLMSFGVIFSSTSSNGVIWNGDSPITAIFSHNFFAGFTGGLVDTSSIRIDFVDPITGNPITASSISVRAFDGGGDLDVFTLSGFNLFDQLVEQQSIGPLSFAGSENGGGETALLTSGGIAYVILETSNTSSGLFFDDLAFTTVPIPQAVWLFGSGLLGLIGFARRKKVI